MEFGGSLECIREVPRWFCWNGAVSVLSCAMDVQCDGDASPQQRDEGKNRNGYQDAHTD
jgi:hypothetical protein